jgi:parallel beta-helix repeat protein
LYGIPEEEDIGLGTILKRLSKELPIGLRGADVGSVLRLIILSVILVVFVWTLLDLSIVADGAPTPRSPIHIKGDAAFTTANGVSSGNGSTSNPFVIQGWEISFATKNGVWVEQTTKHFVLRNITLRGPSTKWWVKAIVFDSVDGGGTIEDISIINPDPRGIELNDTHNFTLRRINMNPPGWVNLYKGCSGMTLYELKSSFISVYDSRDCRLVRCNVTVPGTIGIYMKRGTRISLLECNSSGHQKGIVLEDCSDCVIESCAFLNNSEYDMALSGGNNKLTKTRFGVRGILTGGDHVIDTSNTVNGKPLRFFKNTSHVRVDSNTGQLILNNCHHFVVANLTLKDLYHGLILYNVSDSLFTNLTVSGHNLGVTAQYGNNQTYTACSVTRSYRFSAVSNLTIHGNVIRGGIAYSDYQGAPGTLNIHNNTMEGISGNGIRVSTGYRTDIKVIDCKILNHSSGGIKTDSYNSLIVKNNTITNSYIAGIWFDYRKPVQILDNQLDNVNIGIIAADFSSLVIEGNHISNCNEEGIDVRHYGGTRITNNTITHCQWGINLNSYTVCEYNSIDNCTRGVHYRANLVTFRFNTIRDCSEAGVYVWDINTYYYYHYEISDCDLINNTVGVLLSFKCHNTNVTRCNITRCGKGIALTYPDNAKITYNTIQDCPGSAVEITKGTGISVHHNNFVRCNYNSSSGKYNGAQGYDWADNAWDDDSEGNYWSDYRLRYPNANVNGRIWDTPYDLAGGAGTRDRFPLAIIVDLLPPTAYAGGNLTVDQNTTVTFNGTESTDDIGIVKHEWTFYYDLQLRSLEGATAQFTFDLPGTYKVTLKVRDAWGNSDEDSITITVLDTTPPIAEAGKDITVSMGQVFYLDGRNSRDNVGIVNYNWTVDPGGLDLRLKGPRVQVTLTEPGDYVAHLNVSDAAGYWATDELTILVLDTERPVADAGPDIEVGMGESMVFDGSSSTDNVGITSWNWTFEYSGGTVRLSGERATFTFEVAGIYIVTLRVFDDRGLWDSDEVMVTVQDTERPVARAGEDVEITQHTEVIFRGGASTDNVGITAYLWSIDYGGVTLTYPGVQTRFTFNEAGVYYVMLKVTDAANNSATDVITVTVLDVTPPVAVANVPEKVDQGTPVMLDGTGSYDNDAIRGYTWTFTYDGEPIILDNPSPKYVFDIPGVYDLTLEVTDLEGNPGRVMVTITVIDVELPSVDAGRDVFLIVGSMAKMDGSGSTDNVGIMYYEWTFLYSGAEEVLHGVRPSYQFDKVGAYNITLYVTDTSGNVGSDSMIVTIKPFKVTIRIGPIADGDGSSVVGANVELLFNGTTYSGRTDGEGWVEVEVPWHDLVPPVNVTVSKDGWKTLSFDMSIDEEGNIEGTIPPMEKVDEGPGVSSSLISAILVAVIIAVVVVVSLVIWKRKPRKE